MLLSTHISACLRILQYRGLSFYLPTLVLSLPAASPSHVCAVECVGHAYKIQELTGNGNQSLSDKITNIYESVAVLMADRKGTLDAVEYLDFLAQGTSNRKCSLLRDYKLKYIFIEFYFHLAEQFTIFSVGKALIFF
jgi:hypothetical protein